MSETTPTADEDLWRRPPADAAAHRVDAIAAAALGVGTLLSLMLYRLAGFYDDPAPMWICLLWTVLISAPLAFRRRASLPVACVISAAFIAGQVLKVPELMFANIALFLALYTVGAWVSDRRRAFLVRAVIIAAMLSWMVIGMFRAATDPDALAEFDRAGAMSPLVAFLMIQILSNLLYFGAAYYFGDRAYAAARQRAQLEERTAELEAERDRTAAQAVALERLRIARELHDVVAHHVSLMGLQAGAARTVLATDQAAARDALANVELNSRVALAEMRQLLGTLRDPEPQALAPTTEAPSTLGVAGLHSVIADSTAAGIPTTFEVVGDPREVPPAVGLTVFRLTQEALTNVRRHAGSAATAQVRLRYLPETIELEVTNTGTVGLRPNTKGLGQRGIQERVSAVGGSVELGPRSRGGYLVRAQIPVARS